MILLSLVMFFFKGRGDIQRREPEEGGLGKEGGTNIERSSDRVDSDV